MTINVAEVRFYFSFTWIYILPTLRLNSSITYYTLIASPGYIIAIVGEEHEPISYKLDLCVWYIRPVITLQRCTSSFVDIRPLLLDTLAVPGGGGYSVIRNPVKATISEHKSLLHEDSYRLGGVEVLLRGVQHEATKYPLTLIFLAIKASNRISGWNACFLSKFCDDFCMAW